MYVNVEDGYKNATKFKVTKIINNNASRGDSSPTNETTTNTCNWIVCGSNISEISEYKIKQNGNNAIM